MPALLLQKISRKRKFKEHILHLKRREKLWKCVDVQLLLKEGTVVQIKLRLMNNKVPAENFGRSFAKLSMKGKITSAIQLLSREKS